MSGRWWKSFRFAVVDVPKAVRELALHPFRELRVPPGFERIERDEFLLVLNPYPAAQVVAPRGVSPSTLPASIEAARAIARERGKPLLVWWIGPDRRDLEQSLLDAGLVHEDTPGFEAVESAMVILQAPSGQVAAGVSVKQTETYEEYVAAEEIVMAAFDYPEAMRAEVAGELPKRWDEYTSPSNPGREFIASIDGRIVGTAFAALGEAGVNLFGGAVLEEARGQGVYKALVDARWNLATARGTPALTVQAGRMSRPILAKLGFQDVGQAHLYVDTIRD
jgi:GNAT superfamily N-acetyltransferase